MKIIVISLKESLERRAHVSKVLEGIPFTFFDAINVTQDPQHSTLSLYNPDKTKSYKGYHLTNPELGCFASHISLWQLCVDDQEPYLVLEDNIDILGNIKAQLENIERLTKQYGVVKLGNIFKRSYKKICEIDDNYQLISHKKGACGTSAYVISPNACERYLQKVKGFYEPVDDFMDNEWLTKQTIYSYEPYLVARSNTASTIGNRKKKGKISLKNKLQIEGYRLYKQLRQAWYNLVNKRP